MSPHLPDGPAVHLTQNPPAEHPLAVIRRQRGWSQLRTAQIIAKRAREFGVADMAAERQKVWRWEHRGAVPGRVSQLALAAALGVDPAQVDDRRWPAWLPGAVEYTYLTPATADRKAADQMFAGAPSPAEAAQTAANVLTVGMRHLAAAYATADLETIGEAARYMQARADAYEDRLDALDVDEPAGPEVTDEDLDSSWDTLLGPDGRISPEQLRMALAADRDHVAAMQGACWTPAAAPGCQHEAGDDGRCARCGAAIIYMADPHPARNADPAPADPWAGHPLLAMYGGPDAPRCVTCGRPYSQQEAKAGMTTCEHCPSPACEQGVCAVPGCGHANESHGEDGCAVVGCEAGPDGTPCVETYAELTAVSQ